MMTELSCITNDEDVNLVLTLHSLGKIASSDYDDSRVKIETGNGAGNQLVTLA